MHGWGKKITGVRSHACRLGLFELRSSRIVQYVSKPYGCVIASLIFGLRMSENPVGNPFCYLYNIMKRSSPELKKNLSHVNCMLK